MSSLCEPDRTLLYFLRSSGSGVVAALRVVVRLAQLAAATHVSLVLFGVLLDLVGVAQGPSRRGSGNINNLRIAVLPDGRRPWRVEVTLGSSELPMLMPYPVVGCLTRPNCRLAPTKGMNKRELWVFDRSEEMGCRARARRHQ